MINITITIIAQDNMDDDIEQVYKGLSEEDKNNYLELTRKDIINVIESEFGSKNIKVTIDIKEV